MAHCYRKSWSLCILGCCALIVCGGIVFSVWRDMETGMEAVQRNSDAYFKENKTLFNSRIAINKLIDDEALQRCLAIIDDYAVTKFRFDSDGYAVALVHTRTQDTQYFYDYYSLSGEKVYEIRSMPGADIKELDKEKINGVYIFDVFNTKPARNPFAGNKESKFRIVIRKDSFAVEAIIN